MEHNNTPHSKTQYQLKDFAPLIIILSIVLLCTIIKSIIIDQPTLATFMNNFMGFFFLIFGSFKLINIKNFAQAYAQYDIIAKNFFWYGYLYPFLEILLAIAYLTAYNPVITNSFTLLLMVISAYGVFIELRKGNQFTCACLGMVFTIPMTWVTLAEDILMALMALVMLCM